MLHVKSIIVHQKEQEPFDAQLRKAIQGLNVKDIKYSITLDNTSVGDYLIFQSALILYEVDHS